MVARHGQNSAAARLHLVDGVGLLRPEDQVFEAMLDGWRAQQQARNLAATTIKSRRHAVRAFAAHAEAFPWRWGASDYNDWLGDLRGVRGLRRTTLRAYEDGVRSFGTYLTDPAYDWPAVCEERFGSHPVQVVNMWNTAAHTQESEGDPSNRPFSRCELETLFDYADEQVSRVRGRGRKGWLPAFRDATMFKLAYAYGLRRREVQMLGVADFGPNPHAAEFGDYGVVYVRHGKGKAGSDPRERSVLSVWDWSGEIIDQWISEVRPAYTEGRHIDAMWPSERADCVNASALNTRLARYRAELGFGPGLDFHSFRRSYVTHLIEDGWDPLFVQQQVGHEHASTTAIYTCVSSDYRTRTLRAALDRSLRRDNTGDRNGDGDATPGAGSVGRPQ